MCDVDDWKQRMIDGFGRATDGLANLAESPWISEGEREFLRRLVEEGRAETARWIELDVERTDHPRANWDFIMKGEDCLYRLHLAGLELAMAAVHRSRWIRKRVTWHAGSFGGRPHWEG